MENFTKLAHALYLCSVANKDNKRALTWNDECQTAFEALRSYLTDILVNEVVMEDVEKNVRVKSSRSEGKVLIQVQAIFFKQVDAGELQQQDKEIEWIVRAIKRGGERPQRSDNISKDQAVYFREWENLEVDNEIPKKATGTHNTWWLGKTGNWC